jgi:hypothetical protein
LISPDLRKSFAKVFDQFGIQDFTIEKRGKHPALIFEHRGGKHRIPISGTPSDYRAHQNKLSLLKRYIRNLNDTPSLH